jgi:YHS domain-containing protein
MNASKILLVALHALLLMGVTLAFAQQAKEAQPPVVVKGYDVVSYFQDGKATVGTSAFQQDWDDGRYQFSSAAHKALFLADPDHYVPQFSGFCATGVSKGKKVVADPTVWKIVDGKLYVFYSVQAREMAEQDPALLTRSQENWKTLK